MTPFEELGYKVGYKFEVIGETISSKVVPGDIVTFIKDDGSYYPFFETSTNGIACLRAKEIRPLKTEAEKRGAKFGVHGTVKSTGDRWVFSCEKEGFWKGIMENGVVVAGEPHQFRLDHEPAYREIPFSEATHEQRMVVENLKWDHNSKILLIQISHCEGFYGLTLENGNVVIVYEDGSPILFREENRDEEFRLTVRIPT